MLEGVLDVMAILKRRTLVPEGTEIEELEADRAARGIGEAGRDREALDRARRTGRFRVAAEQMA